MRAVLLAALLVVGTASASLAQSAAQLAGTYTYNGTATDGSPYDEGGTVVVKAAKSGAFEIVWDGGEYVGVGQVVGDMLAVASVAEKLNTIMLFTINPDGSLTGKWWRRTDPGSKGTEVWKKK